MSTEVFLVVLALVIVAVGVYLVLFLKKLGNVVDEAQQSLKVLTSDVNVTLYQANEILAKTNVLVEDANEKLTTLDPLFTAVADLSVTVSDLNTSARNVAEKAKSTGKATAKAGGLITAFNMVSTFLGKNKKGE